MTRTLAKIVLSAFGCGLVAETAYTLYTGSVEADTIIELVICWALVLAVAAVATWKAINGTLVRTIVHTVVVHVPEDEPEDTPEDEPEDTPEDTPERE